MKIKLLHKDAICPTKANLRDAGFDLYCIENLYFAPMETQIISTGISVEIPDNCVGIIKDRSSIASNSFHVLGGVIDSGYRGEIKVIMINYNHYNEMFYKGAKVAQLVVLKLAEIRSPLEIVDELSSSIRGEKGFGSSDQIPAMFCEHANENPLKCRCPENCYCKSHTCKDKPIWK